MSPYQHGEVYVTDDGAEADLDLGHYERFTNTVTSRRPQLDHRQDLPVGDPARAARRLPRRHGAGDSAHHRRDQGLASAPSRTASTSCIVEIGGTVGDIESLPFLEAIRQFRQDVGRENALYIHLTLVPYIGTAGELKTKPTQHSVRELRSIGIQPDILLCRTDRFLPPRHQAQDRALLRRRRGGRDHRARTSSSIYEVPLVLGRGRHRPHRAQAPAPARRPRPTWQDWAALRRAHQAPAGRGDDPRRRQVRRPRGLVQEPERGARPRRLQAPASRST